MREDHRLRVFKNRIPRRISGPKRGENGKCRRPHNEELHGSYCSPNIVRVIKSSRLRWVVLYGCDTWSLTLREEHRLRVFKNRILRPIFGHKRDAKWQWRMFHNEELHRFYCLPNITIVVKYRRLR